MAEVGKAAQRNLSEGPSQFALALYKLQKRIHSFDWDRAAERLTNAVVRGAVAGGSLRGGLNVVSYVVGLLLRQRGRARQRPGQPSPQQLVNDTLRWAAFLGSFCGVTVLTDELIACLGGKKRTQAWRGMAAGLAAGPTLLLTGSKQTHTSLALYVLIRGLALLIRCGNLPSAAPWKRRLLAPTRWEHGDVALMCLCTMQIGYSWIILPSTLPASYIRFLNKHGGKPVHIYQAVRELAAQQAAGVRPGPLASLQGTPLAGIRTSVACDFLHPGQACSSHAASFLPGAYLRAIPVYIPVYVIPALLVHRQRLLTGPAAPQLWRKVGLGILRSSLFLSLYCTLAWRGACTGFQTARTVRGDVLALSVWAGGLATLVEKKSRRMELALYCVSRAAESLALSFGEWGWISKSVVPRRLDVLLFSLASACILHCYEDHAGARRCVFRSKYLTGFDWCLGNTGFQEASISHNPSNADLLLQLESSLEAQPALQPALKVVRSVAALAGMAGNGSGRQTPEWQASNEGSPEAVRTRSV